MVFHAEILEILLEFYHPCHELLFIIITSHYCHFSSICVKKIRVEILLIFDYAHGFSQTQQLSQGEER